MQIESIIDPATRRAYEETEYRVKNEQPFVLRIGRASQELGALQLAKRVNCSAFVTACNPFGVELTDEDNASRQLELAHELKTRSLGYFEGEGKHPGNDWPGEASYLVMGLTLEATKSLGRRLDQNAVVWIGADTVPQLILLR